MAETLQGGHARPRRTNAGRGPRCPDQSAWEANGEAVKVERVAEVGIKGSKSVRIRTVKARPIDHFDQLRK
ncbi:hypothetical protein DPMN_018679 [Dreissena polymorpha]|uniref:Uncharacterized protein n=1 Tax=Dreissena polymorpha TaxID=45954 RepID=A0A9D4NHQ7_DREPO|nr:hypothetical protein DPMN_018679 [Dreissena polymorpha]